MIAFTIYIQKSKLRYTRVITPKRITSGEAHLRGFAPRQHSYEETLRWWRVVDVSVSDLTDPEFEPQPYAPIKISL